MQVDVVQPFLTPATLFGLLPALICRTPVKIVTERNVVKNDGHFGYRLYLKAEDILTRFADWAVPNSEAGRKNLVERGINPSRIKVIYNGINLSRLTVDNQDLEQVKQSLDPPPGGKVVGMMARMFPVKNHAAFLQAAVLINRVVPNTRFALVGDGPLRGYLEDLSQELGLGSKVTFFGEQRDVGTYLAAIDIAALTSETEGCSNSLLEAMALGKPVVATDVGGNREVVHHGETGFLIPPGDVEALAEAIITLLQHPEIARSMGQAGKEMVVSRFSLERMVHEYENMYEETLSRKAGEKKALQPDSP
jgi:glycosyltransferase involved in cell wall biosynthesis